MNIFEFDIKGDFDLRKTLECGQCFRWQEICESEYIVSSSDRICHAKWTGERLRVKSIREDPDFWHSYFDLDEDYGRYRGELIRENPELEDAILYGGGLRILNQDFFEVLISFIISQNNNIPRIKKCIESLCENYGEPIGCFNGKERFAFPRAEVLSKADPRDIVGLKLGYRASYIVEAAKKFMKEGIPQGRDEEKYEKLLSYIGVGPKVANCISLFGFRNFKAFPIDTWIRKMMVDMYGFDKKDTRGMQEYARGKFGSLGGLAQQYLFYYYRDKKIK